jgi:DNA polymerase-3 subunit delta
MNMTLTGANSYLLGAELRKRRDDFVAEYGDLALETIDIAEWETRKVFDSFGALPFLSPKRMLVVYGMAANKPAGEKIEELLKTVDETTDLLLVEPKIDKRSVLYKVLKKETGLREFAEPDPRDLPRWLVSEAKARGGSLSSADAAYLVGRVGAVQQSLSNELDKLLLYDAKVTRQTIDLLTEQAPLSSIFDLIEAAFAGNLKKAMALYGDQRAQNVEPLAIEALFVWQLHALALVKAAGEMTPDALAAETGLSPYVARKSAGLASRRTMAEVKAYVNDLADLEYAIKTTAADADELMKNYILSLAA